MKTLTCASTRQLISLTKQIASSGEGTVWKTSLSGYLAKLYHVPDLQRVKKLEVMIARPPLDPMLGRNHISFAWPKELLQDSNGASIGFLMPTIHQGVSLLNVYNPRLRKQKIPKFNWRYLHTTALNIAWIIQEIHAKGYVLGDIKPQNVLVNDRALISIIDIDSFQVRDPQTGQIYRCTVGSEGFTPPELLGQELSILDQTQVHDNFRLAVIIYLLLFGDHPFKGEWIGAGDPPDPTELIRQGFWPYASNSLIRSGRNTIPLDIAHPELRRCFLRCFNDGHRMPHLRPTAQDWCQALRLATADLVVCNQEDTHYYSRSYSRCYWCERKRKLGVDVFPDPTQIAASILASSPTIRPLAYPKPSPWQGSYASGGVVASLQAIGSKSRKPLKKQSMVLAGGTIVLSVCAYIYLLLYLFNQPTFLAPYTDRLVSAPISSLSDRVSLTDTLAQHTDVVSSIVISPNGQTLVSGGYDGEVKLWNLKTAALTRTLTGHSDWVSSVAISPNGQTLASGGYDGEVKLWNLKTGVLTRTLTGHSGAISSIAISPNGQTLASGGYDEEVRLWNLKTGALTRTLTGHSDWVSSLAISPNGQTLVSGGYDGEVKLWNLKTGALIPVLIRHSGAVTSITVSPDGRALASGSSDGEIKMWNLGMGKLLHSLAGHSSVVTSIAISPDRQTLASSSRDSTIKLWQLP